VWAEVGLIRHVANARKMRKAARRCPKKPATTGFNFRVNEYIANYTINPQSPMVSAARSLDRGRQKGRSGCCGIPTFY